MSGHAHTLALLRGFLLSYRRFSWSTYDFPAGYLKATLRFGLSVPPMLFIAMASWFGLRLSLQLLRRMRAWSCVYIGL